MSYVNEGQENNQEQNYADRLRQIQAAKKRQSVQRAKKAGIDVAKKQVKKAVLRYVIMAIAAAIFNPYTLSVIGGIFIIIIVVVLMLS